MMEETKRSRSDRLLGSWLGLRDLLDANPQMRKLLFDTVTGLPTTPLLFPRIENLLEEHGEVSLVCLDIVRFSKIEEIYGWQVFDSVMRATAEALEEITGTYMRDADIVAELMVSANSFVIILSPPRLSEKLDEGARVALAERVGELVLTRLRRTMDPAVYAKFGCFTGSATITPDPRIRLERLVHEGLESALGESSSREKADAAERGVRLREVIELEQVTTLVQPIVRLADMSVIGYEALSRGPEGGEFEHPDKLFCAAYDSDLVAQLENLCRKKAITAARELAADRLLFINIEPSSVTGRDIRDAVFSGLIGGANLSPDRIVLEITERNAIVDFNAFRSTLEYLRALGFSIAIDDAGSGYASLQCLAEVRPEWLKVDISLIRGIDSDRVRRLLVQSLILFTEEAGVNLIAEGVETEDELAVIRELGVLYAQGFLFCEPRPPFPPDADVCV